MDINDETHCLQMDYETGSYKYKQAQDSEMEKCQTVTHFVFLEKEPRATSRWGDVRIVSHVKYSTKIHVVK